MSKKITLKHALNGDVVTRTTARAYTHVVIASRNPAKVLAKAQADFNEKAQADVIEKAEYDYKYAANLAKVPVGGKYYYHRQQGGSYLNRTGMHMEVKQYQHDIDKEYILCYATMDEYVNAKIVEFIERKNAAIAAADKVDTREFVASWHGSRANADKAGSSQWKTSCCDYRIEEINNGVAA
jgi:hypothetical protein